MTIFQPQPSMNNRRNYYRILNVQPDASMEVIRANYRALLQKLKLHPDLGGDSGAASGINQAYQVLRNPEKRAAYDNQLLQEYSIKTLSSAGITLNADPDTGTPSAGDSNQRNYYRVLEVQIDSPLALIKSSYHTLKKNHSSPKRQNILDEAYQVLTDQQLKQQYDHLLRTHGHSYAANRLKPLLKKSSSTTKEKPVPQQPFEHAGSKRARKATSTATQNTVGVQSTYQPVILQYCAFCKTPHNHNPSFEQDSVCIECRSPLYAPPENLRSQYRRELGRLKSNQKVTVYHDWPVNGKTYRILDISPTGLKIQSPIELDVSSLMKIDGTDFQAVGEIIYCESEKNAYHVGINLITVKYHKIKGQFFSAQA